LLPPDLILVKKHQIWFWLGLRPRPRWKDYSTPPYPSWAGFYRVLLLREGKGQKRGGQGKGRNLRKK